MEHPLAKHRVVGKVLALQLAVSVLMLLALWPFFGLLVAGSVLFGGCLVALNNWMLARTVMDADRLGADRVAQSVYWSAAKRFVWLVACLLIAGVFGFHLLAVAGGMLAAYVASYFFAAAFAFGQKAGE